ncbi:MAG: FAD-dependent oxidoreductase [Candidatus Saganbacteria bacterium]|nr:FAD-dependent oxidoreductase [Candidatus Saganbacteria bacterium]
MNDIQTDVLVCGAGPAGFAAAIAASRLEVKVLLLERYGFLGGMAAAGIVNPFMVPKLNGEPLVKGIFEEITERLKKENGCAEGSLFDQPHIIFDQEVLKNILFEMIDEAQIKLLLHSFAVASIMKGNEIKGVVAAGKSGDIKIFAKRVVDATGDGDIAALSGAEFEKGRPQDHLSQPMTLMFRVSGIDEENMPSREKIDELFLESKRQGRIRTPRENFLWFETTRKGEIQVNSTRVPKVDGTDVLDLTKAEVEARKQVSNLFKFLKTVPGFENSYISLVAPQVGVRESRRVAGEYRLTENDVMDGTKFDDPVARCNYPIDIHSPDGRSTTFRKPGPGTYYEIPYRCLVPKKIENLLVAGRCISVTHEALSSMRIMPVCMALGQAAGAAAAISLKKHVTPRKIDYCDLRKVINEQGAEMR